MVSCTAVVLSHRTGQAEDISWPSSPIGAVSCTAFGVVSRTAFEEERRGEEGRKEEEVTEENLTTTTLTVGNNKQRKHTHSLFLFSF